MALFEGLSAKLAGITAKMRGKSRVTDQDIKDMMREIRLALLEADVNYAVVRILWLKYLPSARRRISKV
jgi:signal recognition particle subunit SRP54